MTKKDIKASEDLTNMLFMDLIQEDKAKLVDRIAVDSGQIAIGDCDTIQLKVNTTTGDGFYPVWKGKKYVVIEIDMLNIMNLDKECKLAKEWKTDD